MSHPIPTLTLELPNPHHLPQYTAALETGWSPNNTQDVSAAHLAAIATDPAAFLAAYDFVPGSTIRLPDGSERPRLPGPLFWIMQDGFCGFMSLRYQPGTTALPDHVSGHIGYGVVPWRRGEGIASRALRAVLPHAAAAGLQKVLITATPENAASRRVIESAGGILDPHLPPSDIFGPRVGYWVQTAR